MRPARTDPRNRFDAFLIAAPFSASKLARVADTAIQTVSEIRSGRSIPKIDTAERLRRAASTLLGREVAATELFDLGA